MTEKIELNERGVLKSGVMYKRFEGIWWNFILVFLGGKKSGYGMLHLHKHEDESLSCPMLQHDENGEYEFTEEELKEKWGSDNWVKLNGRLTFEIKDECWTGEYIKLI